MEIDVTIVRKPPVDADIVTVETEGDGFAEASDDIIETGSPTMVTCPLLELEVGVFGSAVIVEDALKVVEPSAAAVWTYWKYFALPCSASLKAKWQAGFSSDGTSVRSQYDGELSYEFSPMYTPRECQCDGKVTLGKDNVLPPSWSHAS